MREVREKMFVQTMAPKLGSKGLQAAMNRHLDNLHSGRKPKALPMSSQIKSSPSEIVKAARAATRGILKTYFDIAIFVLKNAILPFTMFTSWGDKHQLPALRSAASLVVYLYFLPGNSARKQAGWRENPLSMKMFLMYIAHVAGSAYITRQQYLTDSEEEQLAKTKQLYTNFRMKALKLNKKIQKSEPISPRLPRSGL